MAQAAEEIADTDSWETVSLCAQRMSMAWDHVEMQDEAASIVRYSTDRQRAYIFAALWDETDDSFRHRARLWIEQKWAEEGNEND